MGIHGCFVCMLLLLRRLLSFTTFMRRSTCEQCFCPDRLQSRALGLAPACASCQPGTMVIADAIAFRHQDPQLALLSGPSHWCGLCVWRGRLGGQIKRHACVIPYPRHMPAPLISSSEMLQLCKLPQYIRGTFPCICNASLQALL